MNPKKTTLPAFLAAAVVLSPSLLGFTTASAQTPPTPTHTFQPAGASGTFGTAGNWSPGLPGAGNDVLIADGKTANGMTQTEANTLFGSLTLGVGSTLNLAASNTAGLASNSVLYFNNGSQLNYTSGGTNRANTYNIVSGATVGMHLGQVGGDSLPQGTMVGGSNTVVNMTTAITLNMRLNASSFNGTLNFKTNAASSARAVNFGNASNSFGSGIANIDTFVRVTGSKSNWMNDSGTLQLTGSSGGASNVKFDMGGSTDTIGNFVIDSPIGATASAPTLRGSAAAFTVTGTTTFQGTAGAVNFDSSNGTPSSHNLLTTGNMTFGGTGTWALSGDGRIRLNAASGTRTITTNTDASIANVITGSQGFTKAGVSTLTLSGNNTYTGDTNVNEGVLAVNGSLANTATTVESLTSARLQGAGLIAGSVTIGDKGTLAAGNSIESLGGGDLGLNDGSIFEQEIRNADPTDGADLFYSSGMLSLSGTVTLDLVNITDAYAWVPGDKITLISYTGTPSLSSKFSYAPAPGGDLDDGETFDYDGAQWVFRYQGATPGGNYQSDALLAGTNFVTMTVVPEAGTTGLLALGLLLLRRLRHR